MLRVRTLGGLSVDGVAESASRTPLQRRPLALLAVLAASRTGVSRDKLVAYFWPESDEERARNVLRQLVHTVRRDVGIPDLIVGSTELRLNPSLSTSDVAEFDAACDAGELDRAVAVYDGPFLSGFYLTNAPAFEAWKEGERARLAQRFARAVEQLASHATALGDHTRALESWRRLAAVEPLNSRVAIALMRALAAAGDVGGALAHARVHEAMMREELEATPGAEFEAAVAGVRSSSERPHKLEAGAATARPSHESVERTATLVRVDEAPTVVGVTSASVQQTRARWFFVLPRRRVAALLTLSMAIAVAIVLPRWRGEGRAKPAADLAPQIAVLPFEDNTPGAGFGWLANGLAMDLIDALSASPSLSVRSPEATRSYRGGAATLDSIVRALGVGTVLSGSIDVIGDSLRINVRVTDARTGSSAGPAIRVFTSRATLERARQQVVDSVAAAMRAKLGEYLVIKRRLREAGSGEAWELVQRADEGRQEALENIRRGDASSAITMLVLADSQLARAERLAPRWPEPMVLRGWIAEARAVLAAEQPSDRCATACIGWRRSGIVHATRALKADDHNAAALELRGTLYSLLHLAVVEPAEAGRSLLSAEHDLQRAILADSNRARAWLSLGRVYHARGDFIRAEATTERALRTDPWLQDSRDVLHLQFFDALMRGAASQASRLCSSGQRTFRDHRAFAECRLWVLGWYGSTTAAADSAARELRRVESMVNPPRPDYTWGYRRAMLGAVLARAGNSDSARAVLAATERVLSTGDPNWRFQRAWVELVLGDTITALRSLAQFARERPQRRQVIARAPWFVALRGDPRFEAVVREPD